MRGTVTFWHDAEDICRRLGEFFDRVDTLA